jgi:AraC-like DNA-binding protein
MKEFYQNLIEPYKAYLLKNYEFSPHLHNQLEIVYILSGCCNITIDNVTYRLQQNDVAIIFPYQLHNFSKHEDCNLLVQVFSPQYAREYIPFLGSHIPENPVVCNIPEDFSYAIKKAYENYEQSRAPQVIQSYVCVFMSFLLQYIKLIPSNTSDCHDIMHSLLIYIDEHFIEHITLETLSKQLHVTKFYISRIFNQKVHTTFPDYLNHLRIEYARQLLKHTYLSICEIAFESGFKSERNFFRIFGTQMQMTPLQYRKNTTSRKDDL